MNFKQILLSCLLLGAGCISAPRPVPQRGQALATVQGGGVVLSVPRLDHGAYPDDVLDIAAAVYVVIENRGSTEVQVAAEDFSLETPGGMRYLPVPPQQLVVRAGAGPSDRAAAASIAPAGSTGILLAGPARGGGLGGRGGFVPAPRAMGPGMGVRPAPGFGGGYRGGGYRGGYWGGGVYRGGLYYGPRLSWDPFFPYYYYPGWYGMYWWGPHYYARSPEDALRLGLAPGRLPPGGRAAGFLYFPRAEAPEGAPLTLRWQVHDAQSHNVLFELVLPLEQAAD